ncbi:toll/interleukin-1 receptor domain-containing protein [Brevundimonas sp.]|uniref:toll/interleukin-1 receptor domain-containing protein n=1 Tax=Brevundimonas sp. TaxID=1871086 RepID=UPI002737A432|nr:toll/interleukin-1 receptor domain-containing protein [Brevundimonas sp.]MDP3802728.1 toll/interleukin-1 receptor domain-containing protein [Brevundimonas sp.]
MAINFTFPGRLPGLLRQLVAMYRRAGLENRAAILEAARVGIELQVETDNWNGGSYGHDVVFYLPLDTLVPFTTELRKELTGKLAEDLNGLITRSNEHVRECHLELADENDPEYQAAKEYQGRPVPNPDTIEFWKPGLVRAFITHRDEHKAGAHRLADALEQYGISCFVAHDTIPAQTEWRQQIMLGLETMEIMIVYFTDDFEESIWTQQEIGYALGAQKPIVCVKLGKKAPGGFVGHIQATPGSLDNPEGSAAKLYKLLAKELGAGDRLNNALIEAFAASPSWGETTDLFKRMTSALTSLMPAQRKRVVEAFNSNNQLYAAAYLVNSSNRMVRWMNDVTGETYELHGGRLRLKLTEPAALGDDIPF